MRCPFYEAELRGLDDAVKNAKIKELSTADANAFYQIGKGKIVVSEKWSAFISENYSTICDYNINAPLLLNTDKKDNK